MNESHTVIPDFSQSYLLSSITSKLRIRFFFDFPRFSHTNYAKTIKILNVTGKPDRSATHECDIYFYRLLTGSPTDL